MSHTVAVLVGSLRKESYNRRFALALSRLLPADFRLEFVDIGTLPLYNQDLDSQLPAAAVHFKQQIEAADALLFVTPEYNRSVPGVLKNALDWGSRPWGKNSWVGKPAAVAGTSPGAIGTALAQQHLRNILAYLDVQVLGQPEIFLQYKDGLIDDAGQIGNDDTRAYLQGFADRYAAWVRQHCPR
ncbi:MAG: NADPH-dependent FMN reductase [Microvirgula sp.]